MKRQEKNIPRKISDQCLKSFLKENFSQTEVSNCCQMTREAVRQRIKAMGISYKDVLYRKRKTQAREISKAALNGDGIGIITKKLPYSDGLIRARVKEFNIPIFDKRRNNKRLAEILFLRTKGYSKKEIAEELDMVPSSLNSTSRFKAIAKFKFVHGKRGY